MNISDAQYLISKFVYVFIMDVVEVRGIYYTIQMFQWSCVSNRLSRR